MTLESPITIRASTLALAGLDPRLKEVLHGRYFFSSADLMGNPKPPVNWAPWDSQSLTPMRVSRIPDITLVVDGTRVEPSTLVEIERRHWILLLVSAWAEHEDESKKDFSSVGGMQGRVLTAQSDSRRRRVKTIVDEMITCHLDLAKKIIQGVTGA